jgi:hypothetical protein
MNKRVLLGATTRIECALGFAVPRRRALQLLWDLRDSLPRYAAAQRPSALAASISLNPGAHMRPLAISSSALAKFTSDHARSDNQVSTAAALSNAIMGASESGATF